MPPEELELILSDFAEGDLDRIIHNSAERDLLRKNLKKFVEYGSHLHLASKMDAFYIKKAMEFIGANPNINSVSFYENQIQCRDQAEVEELASFMTSFLKTNKTLQTVNYSSLGETALQIDMGEVVKYNTTLKNLNLSVSILVARLAEGLKHNSSLQYLGLNSLNADGFSVIADAARTMGAIRELNLSVSILVARLAEGLKHNSSLQYLGLNSLNADGFSVIADAARTMGAIRELNLSNNYIGNSRKSSLEELLKQNKTLTSLDLTHNKIGNEALSSIVSGLEYNASLTSINLANNFLDDDAAVDIVKILKFNSSLRKLDLSGNELDSKGVSAILNALSSNSSLRELNLGDNTINDGLMEINAEGFRSNNSLQVLNLRCNQITEATTSILAGIVHNMHALRELFLGSISMGNIGATALGDALQDNACLQKLELYSNDIGDIGATALANVLPTMRALRDLDLESNDIGDIGATALANALQTMRSLKELILCRNGISDVGAVALADALRVNNGLLFLSLAENKLTGKGASDLLNALQVNRALKKLYLCENNFSNGIDDKLVKALDGSALGQLSIEDSKLQDKDGKIITGAFKGSSNLRSIEITSDSFTGSGILSMLKDLKDNKYLYNIRVTKHSDYSFRIADGEQKDLLDYLNENLFLTSFPSRYFESNHVQISQILEKHKEFIHKIAREIKSAEDISKLAWKSLWFLKFCNDNELKGCFTHNNIGEEAIKVILDSIQTKKIDSVKELMQKMGICKELSWETPNSKSLFLMLPAEIIRKIFIEAYPELEVCLQATLKLNIQSPVSNSNSNGAAPKMLKRKSEGGISSEAKKVLVEVVEILVGSSDAPHEEDVTSSGSIISMEM